ARALAGVTHGATLVGTFGYMPFEQLGGTVDATSDLYALGATLVHLLGRKAPEDVLGPDLELRLDHLRVSPAFRAFLGRLPAGRRASRPASAVEALRLLDAPPPRARPSVARILMALAAALVIGAAGVSFVAMLRAARSGAEAERARRAQIEALQR